MPDVRLPDTCDCWTDLELAARSLYCYGCTTAMSWLGVYGDGLRTALQIVRDENRGDDE